jgi:hypothetical protein
MQHESWRILQIRGLVLINTQAQIPLLKEEGAKRGPDRAKPQEKGGIKR